MKNRKTVIIYAVNALLIIIAIILIFQVAGIGRTLLSQQAAESWAGESDERFAQVSAFFPPNATKTRSEIIAFRETLNKKLIDAGVEPREQGENWTDAYSTQSTVQVEGERGKSSATAIAVGGDYYLFHPYYLLSGSFISDDTLMQDRVVLDYELAWKLFGGTELEGMTIDIDGKPYYVAGVVMRETDRYSSRAYSGDPIIFMPYSALTDEENEAGITSYELVMLDPISNYVSSAVKEGLAGEKGAMVENSARYGFFEILDIFIDFGERSIQANGIAYPYWENAARLTELYIARLYVIIALLLVYPLICAGILIVRGVKSLLAKTKQLAFKTWDAWDDRYARRDAAKERKLRKTESKNDHVEDEDILFEGRFRLIKNKISKIFFHKKPKDTDERKRQTNDTPEPMDDDKELSLDIESIVRQVMEENAGKDDFR